MLINHYDFPITNVSVILDEQATKVNIVQGVKDLLRDAKPGDVLVFTNSSHGTSIADIDGDEHDGPPDIMYDEAICPYDSGPNKLLIDDELRHIINKLPQDVHLTVISDSCCSGSITRLTPLPDDDRTARLVDSELFGYRSLRGFLMDDKIEEIGEVRSRNREKYPESAMKEILLSGCEDIEVSYDARFGNIYHGAMTYCALQVIRDANYSLTYKELHDSLTKLIKQKRYPQHPQLEGTDANKQRQIFT